MKTAFLVHHPQKRGGILPRQHHAQEDLPGRRRYEGEGDPTISAEEAESRRIRTFFDRLLDLERAHGPDLVTVRDAAKMYPTLGRSHDGEGCPFAYPPWRGGDDSGEDKGDLSASGASGGAEVLGGVGRGSERRPAELPEVLLVSGLDKSPTGPSAIFEVLTLLLECARCEALSPWVVAEEEGDADADACFRCQRPPAGGPSRGPGCDFPLPLPLGREGPPDDDGACMTTYPARVLGELVRWHAFQLGVTLRGAGEGGEEEGPRIEVPIGGGGGGGGGGASIPPSSADERAAADLARALGAFASSGGGSAVARRDRPSVRPLSDACPRGGAPFEAFAATAATGDGRGGGSVTRRCASPRGSDDDAGGFDRPSERTGRYDEASLRAVVARVVVPPSASPVDELPGFAPPDDGDPSDRPDDPDRGGPPRPLSSLVASSPLADPSPLGCGVRASLLATELVEPYAIVRSVGGVALRDDDVVPSSPRVPGACRRTRSMVVPQSSLLKDAEVTWTVGGSLEVAETAIMYGKWDVLDGKVFDCATQPTKQELDAFFTILRDFEVMEGESAEQMADDVNFTPVHSGFTRWHPSGSSGGSDGTPSSSASVVPPPETTFSISLDLSDYNVGDVVAVYALARTDQGWASGDGEAPARTHAANVRTDPTWSRVRASSADGGEGALVRGRLDWFSVPVTIEIGPRPGFFEGNEPVETSVRPSDEGFEPAGESGLDAVAYSLFMAVVAVAVTLFCVFCREERDGT
ncbi:hypothetical protein ACHAWF_009747, partial [Thalassiosira exigua]